MKIAADYYEKGLGKSLGFLVGALVLGTAFPHLLKGTSTSLPWKYVLMSTSSIAVLGGTLMILLVPDGPFRKVGTKLNFKGISNIFRNRAFRGAAFGYFGHMWELYTFWAFVPVILKAFNATNNASLDIPLWSFIIIGIGSFACVIGGYLSNLFGTKKVAFLALLLSGICCILSPLILQTSHEILIIVFLLFWGLVVIADSPLFSTLVAQSAPAEIKGTALTMVNCIGFSITIVSIQLINYVSATTESNWPFALLGLGPILGLLGLSRSNK
jgi:hypothetical protein